MLNEARIATLNLDGTGARLLSRFGSSDSPGCSAIPRALERATLKRRERRAPGHGSWEGFMFNKTHIVSLNREWTRMDANHLTWLSFHSRKFAV
jgi:hypothetical protein